MKTQSGNALLYVMIAVGLMAALTFALSRDNKGTQANRMDEVRVDLKAAKLIEHAMAAEQAIFQMTQWGTDYGDIKFDTPDMADYDTDITQQIYHPQGGGLSVFKFQEVDYEDPNTSASSVRGWRYKNTVNVGWSATTAPDLIYSFLDLHPAICAVINERLVGHASIPMTTLNYSATFANSMAPDVDFTSGLCAECENVKALCVQNSDTYAFYNIIGSR